MENTHRRPSGKRPKKRRFRGNQIMKVCSHTYVLQKGETKNVCFQRWRHKTFNALSENKPYGDDHLIQKIECVGHVQKRMGTRLRKLILVYSKKKLSDGKTIGGKGRLTDSLIDKLAHLYGNAIRCNSTSVKEMRKAIWAVWGHSCSTDDEPMH
ncbi:uncharacterized protein TNCV_3275751 [Trichonephila clavipes]|nr:uncharacterized protein TNCV_3275751 [Trichonephila clavipes]